MRADDAWRSMVTRTPARFIEAASFLNRMMQVTSSLFDFNGCAANPSMRGIHTLKFALKIQFSSISPQSGGLGGSATIHGLTQWRPAFLKLGNTLDFCAAIYRKFCQQYRPKTRPPKKSYWGCQVLEKLKQQMKTRKRNLGQKSRWDDG